MAKRKIEKSAPAAKDALFRFKQELADELEGFHPQNKHTHPYEQTPSVGDYLVEQMIKTQQEKMK